jgi:catechol 2,3-dioxygenase-like lactoylglutathione lyase family enzyme
MGTQTITRDATRNRTDSSVDLKLEVVVIPVADVDRAKNFYQGLGWRVDADFSSGNDWRLVQLTPPGSPCSVMIGKGFTSAVPGSVQGTFLAVDNLERARAELVEHGADVSDVFHFTGDRLVVGSKGRTPGRDPQGRSYLSFASFSDPDGNSWLLQEITGRLPGRGFSSFDVASLTELLKETEAHHGEYEPKAPKHHWSEWYAGYIVARARGKSAEEAITDATIHVETAHSPARA